MNPRHRDGIQRKSSTDQWRANECTGKLFSSLQLLTSDRSVQQPTIPVDTLHDAVYFQRGLEDLRLETRHDDATNEYLLTVHAPTSEIVERFTDVFSGTFRR